MSRTSPRTFRRSTVALTILVTAAAFPAASTSAAADTDPGSPSPTATTPTTSPTTSPTTPSPSPSGTPTTSPSPTTSATPTSTLGPTGTTGGASPTPTGVADAGRTRTGRTFGTPEPDWNTLSTTQADQRIADKLTLRATSTRFGSGFSGTVLDAESDEVVWSKRPNSTYMPASNAKLFTAATALDTLGANTTFTTYVKIGSKPNHVVIVGNGDPLLDSNRMTSLARQTADYLEARGITNPRVYVDDDYFPTPSLAPGWKSSYVPADVTPVRALVLNNADVMDTSHDAAIYFRWKLRTFGLSDAGYFGRQNSSSSKPTIARINSVPVRTMVNRMLLTSDNDVAEILLRKASSTMGNGRTWSGARTTQSQGAARVGESVGVLYDGSGLSRSDRVSTAQLAGLIRKGQVTNDPDLQTLRSTYALPTAGRTGTLKNRFTSSYSKCAVGKVWAKTGTLNDVVALSGWTVGADGRVKVFSFLVNGRSVTTTLKNNVDMLAATVNGCY